MARLGWEGVEGAGQSQWGVEGRGPLLTQTEEVWGWPGAGAAQPGTEVGLGQAGLGQAVPWLPRAGPEAELEWVRQRLRPGGVAAPGPISRAVLPELGQPLTWVEEARFRQMGRRQKGRARLADQWAVLSRGLPPLPEMPGT